MRLVNQPTGWWGWHWEPPVPLSIVQIIAAGSMSPRLASLLWLAMERGASVIVASSPPGAGKTVTLTALLAFTPPETVGYFTRGVGETFSLPPLSPHGPTYILVNELSDHLPVYTWGPYARKVFELMAQGYSLASTMHADTVEEVLDQLAELGIPTSHLASLDLVITLYVGRGQGRALVRRVRDVAFIQQEDQGCRVLQLARWCPEEDTFQVAEDGEARRAFLSWAGLDEGKLEEELRARSQFLESLLAQGVVGIPQVAEAIAAFHRP